MRTISRESIRSKAKCPVCGMFVNKYPKWTAVIETSDGTNYYFDGVKDMMKFMQLFALR